RQSLTALEAFREGSAYRKLSTLFALTSEPERGDEDPNLGLARNDERDFLLSRACCSGSGLSCAKGRRLDSAGLPLSHWRNSARTAAALYDRRHTVGTTRADLARYHRLWYRPVDPWFRW